VSNPLVGDIRAYKERWQAVEAIERQERSQQSIQLRWLQLNSLYNLAVGLGLTLDPHQDELGVWQRWAKIKEEYERNTT
jgi:hypothetical protein